MKRNHRGSSFENCLAENGILEECRESATKFNTAREREKAIRGRRKGGKLGTTKLSAKR